MRRHELSDEQWDRIKDQLPRSGRGGQWKDHRRVIDGVLWVLATGAAWRDLPERYGPWQTGWRRFNAWRGDGTWQRLLTELQARADAAGHVDWELWCVDGTNIRAVRPAAGARKKTVRVKSRRTTA
jgi:transposase